jgi:2-methylcitrate dehydratase PrpD
VAAAVSGTLARIAAVTAEFAVRAMPGQDATILATGQRASAAGAAFANANTANAFDVDDVGQYTRGHPGAQIIPTALAMAEKLNRSGKDVLTAMVAGYEVAHRTGRCWHDDHQVYHACGSWGSVANAATAAHLMHLDVTQIWHTLGIADYHAPNLPMMRDAVAPGMVKHGAGWAALTGILAAEMAQAGFTGIPSILSFEKYRDWVTDIGQNYIIVGGAMFKEHALCGWSHAAVEAVKHLEQKYTFTPQDIEHIRLEGFYEMVLLGSKPPRNTEEAQYNTGWGMTMQMLDGEVGPRQLLEDRLSDPQALDLLSKIELVETKHFNAEAMRASLGDADAEFSCQVEITLHDGQALNSGIVAGHNKYRDQWGDTQMQDKFRWLAGTVLSGTDAERLLDMAWNFETVQRSADLIDFVQTARRAVA